MHLCCKWFIFFLLAFLIYPLNIFSNTNNKKFDRIKVDRSIISCFCSLRPIRSTISTIVPIKFKLLKKPNMLLKGCGCNSSRFPMLLLEMVLPLLDHYHLYVLNRISIAHHLPIFLRWYRWASWLVNKTVILVRFL